MSGYRLPNFSGGSEKEQLRQLKSYLYQLVEQLNYHQSDAQPHTGAAPETPAAPAAGGNSLPDFAGLKAMIIKSADIVEAYCQEMEKRLEGRYVAQSEFGTYAEETVATISANSRQLEQKYESLQTVVTGLETKALETQGYIRTGMLYYAGANDPLPDGAPVYGMEVGQETADGDFRRFSRFTSYSLTFFDSAGEVFATISEGALSIRHGAVTHSFTLGGFADEVQPDGSLVTRWKGA